MRRLLIVLFSFLLLFEGSLFVSNQHAAAGTLPTTVDTNNPNIYYFVALFSYDIWRRSDGVTWTSDGYPGQLNKSIPKFDYSFDFPGRKIKSVKVARFVSPSNWSNGEEIWNHSRYYQKTWGYISKYTSQNFIPTQYPITGLGTSSVSFDVSLVGDLNTSSNNDVGEDVTSEGGPVDPGVISYRYYFPSMLTIELEPEGGKAIIKHYTTTGQSLNGISGFTDREEVLIKNSAYSFTHTSGNTTYEYQGFKKSTVAAPSGGTIEAGDPYGFTYDGSYPVYYLSFYYKVKDPPDPGEGSGECTYTIEPPNKIAAPQTSFMEPNANGVILGDDAANGRHFDVSLGIPTSENLYANAWAKDYLFEHTFANMAGVIRYSCSVKVTYPTKWEEDRPNLPGPNGTSIPQSPLPRTGKFDKTYTFDLTPKEYAYWQVDQLAVYQIDQARMENYALPGGEVTLYPNNYDSPAVELINSIEVEDHVVPQDTGGIKFTPEVVDGGDREPGPGDVDDTDKLIALAEIQTQDPEVQNDRLVFNGETIMDDTVSIKTGLTPGRIPDPQIIGDEVLYEGQLMINSGLLNRQNTTSTGTIYYTMLSENVEGNGDQEFLISPINSVTVHTPVVNYSLLPDDNRPFDQRMTPDMTRAVLILDRPFAIHFTESGQHLNIPGYGNRDYAKYTKNKRIQFPFGVFQGSQYYPENTWIYIPVGTPSMTFTMPTWVNEGDYTIHTQSWAINAPSDGSDLCEVNLNGNLTNYCASESFNVGVVGRLFDFRIWDIGDFRFEKVFRTGVGTFEHSNAMYYTGGNDENGIPTALTGQLQWQLPIRKGSHPTEQRTVPHNGYSFLFDFRTIGNLWQPGEGIRIEPSFYFIPKTGGTATPVDLYYDISGSKNKMIGVGSPKDKLSYTRTYRLADGLRNISSGELSIAASYEYNYIMTQAERDKTPWFKFYKQYLKRKTKIAYGYDMEVLPFESRTLVGPTDIPNVVNPITAVRSVQHWYGEYNLPIAPYILPKGTNIVTLANQYGGALDGHEKEFITGGYILVNFQIYTTKNGDADTRILGYKAPIANMWAIEGQMTGSTDEMGQTFSFSSGDIILFESDYSVRNDYQGQGR
ncbi:DUF5704 domain-containing protein [Paenibacillus sp. FSL F4-0236]|uniref:DUF5704 domain-containing protein n=1 Tax=Paenibacillus sp. FSL F4-0236 TaxID=2954731 RepID=UPI0030FAC200